MSKLRKRPKRIGLNSASLLPDERILLETPEGIELEFEVAGPVVRALAWLLDLAIRSVGYIAASFVLSALGAFGEGTLFVSIFLIEWLYPVAFEVTLGATPGKRAFGLVVCNDNGTPISWSGSILRNLLRVADFLPAFYGLGLVVMMWNKEFKRLGDMVGSTLVVYNQKTELEHEFEGVTSYPPPRSLKPLEQHAILDFAERSHWLSEARAQELANLLDSLTGERDERAVRRLYAYANWMKKGGQ